jgi:hypothetical protein
LASPFTFAQNAKPIMAETQQTLYKSESNEKINATLNSVWWLNIV